MTTIVRRRLVRRSAGVLAAACLATSAFAAPATGAPGDDPERPLQPVEAHEQLHGEANAEERAVAEAAAWTPDPKLLAPKPGDSPRTRRARVALAEVARHLRQVMKAYDAARAEADKAEDAADAAREELTAARNEAGVAQLQFESDRRALTQVINNLYATGSIGALGMVLEADDGDELVTSMSLLQQVGEGQAEAVERAASSAAALQRAEAAVTVLDAAAQDSLAAANTALKAAERARDDVVHDVEEAKLLLNNAVLADEAIAAAKASALGIAAGSKLAFPLDPRVPFVDQGNWGRIGGRWRSVHTGDDFSVACGTAVRAATGGTVSVRTDQSWSGPWLVTVSAVEGGLSTWYAHMQSIAVADGQKVRAGQALGAVGTEGNSSGCHLHFEVHPAGGSIYEDHIDPVTWLRLAGVYPGAPESESKSE